MGNDEFVHPIPTKEQMTELFEKELLFFTKANARSIAASLAKKAAEGDLKATEMIMERTMGKVKDTTTISVRTDDHVRSLVSDDQIEKILAAVQSKKKLDSIESDSK